MCNHEWVARDVLAIQILPIMLADHCNHYLINVWWEIYRLPKDLAKMSESLRMRQSSSKNPVGTDNNLYKTTNSYHNLRYALKPHIHTWWNTLQYPLTNLWNTNWGQKYRKAKFASFCQLFLDVQRTKVLECVCSDYVLSKKENLQFYFSWWWKSKVSYNLFVHAKGLNTTISVLGQY